MIWSEEIKYALRYGYQFKVKYSYKFTRGKDLFDKFVNKEYEFKQNATDPIKRSISKLNLNSVYGKFGAKDHEEVLKIVSLERANYIKKYHSNTLFVPLTDDKVLVRYGKKINSELIKLIKDQEDLHKGGTNKMNDIANG